MYIMCNCAIFTYQTSFGHQDEKIASANSHLEELYIRFSAFPFFFIVCESTWKTAAYMRIQISEKSIFYMYICISIFLYIYVYIITRFRHFIWIYTPNPEEPHLVYRVQIAMCIMFWLELFGIWWWVVCESFFFYNEKLWCLQKIYMSFQRKDV